MPAIDAVAGQLENKMLFGARPSFGTGPVSLAFQPFGSFSFGQPVKTDVSSSLFKFGQLAVVPKGYPKVHIGGEELVALEELIVDAICDANNETEDICFENIEFKKSYILLDCKSKATEDWLKKAMPELKGWSGPVLDVKREEDIPKLYLISATLAKSSNYSIEKILGLIKNQNRELKVADWVGYSLKAIDTELVLRAGVDKLSLETIVKNNHKINYRFGQVIVKEIVGEQNDDEKENETVVAEAEEEVESTATPAEDNEEPASEAASSPGDAIADEEKAKEELENRPISTASMVVDKETDTEASAIVVNTTALSTAGKEDLSGYTVIYCQD